MNDKEIYLRALNNNNGKLDELMLGESIGFDDDKTMRIISQLLTEYRIEFEHVGSCSYKVK